MSDKSLFYRGFEGNTEIEDFFERFQEYAEANETGNSVYILKRPLGDKKYTYDYDKADSVEAGYLPDVDETLQSGTGICFDYAALTAAMLRSQDIPCKLEIGYSGDIKHAWIDVYIQNKGWVTKAISFNGDTWKLMDPTFDANSNGNEAIQEYIGDESNYTVQYTH